MLVLKIALKGRHTLGCNFCNIYEQSVTPFQGCHFLYSITQGVALGWVVWPLQGNSGKGHCSEMHELPMPGVLLNICAGYGQTPVVRMAHATNCMASTS
jgi:hypothetical protein